LSGFRPRAGGACRGHAATRGAAAGSRPIAAGWQGRDRSLNLNLNLNVNLNRSHNHNRNPSRNPKCKQAPDSNRICIRDCNSDRCRRPDCHPNLGHSGSRSLSPTHGQVSSPICLRSGLLLGKQHGEKLPSCCPMMLRLNGATF
jgi:hypothetical protein